VTFYPELLAERVSVKDKELKRARGYKVETSYYRYPQVSA